MPLLEDLVANYRYTGLDEPDCGFLAWGAATVYQAAETHGPGCDPRVALPAADPPDNL